MKLIARLSNGNELEFREIKGLNEKNGLLLMRLAYNISPKDMQNIEDELTEKLGVRVVLIPDFIEEILSI